MPSSAGPSSPSAALAEALENSARLVDRHLQEDRCFPDLSELLGVPANSESWAGDQRGQRGSSVGVYIRTAHTAIITLETRKWVDKLNCYILSLPLNIQQNNMYKMSLSCNLT